MSFGFSIGDFVTIIGLANKIRKDFVGAPSQLQNIANEVRNLSILLQDVEIASTECELGDLQQTSLDDIAGSCHHVLLDLQKFLDRYSSLNAHRASSGNRLKRIWKRLDFEPEDIIQLRDRLTSNVTLLTTYLALVSSQQTSAVRKGVELLLHGQDNHDRRAILDWLTPTDQAAQQSDFINLREPATGQWLLDSPEFQAWLQTDKRTLFCSGIPGAGKTILASVVVDELTRRFKEDKTVDVAYLYCNFRRYEQRVEELIASLLKQLSQGRPTLPESVKSLYDKHRDQRTRPSFDELSNGLRSVAAAYQRVFVVVDALDECQNTDGCRQRFLTEMLHLVDTYKINLFATSRDIPEITERFQAMARLEIRASPEDIRKYVDGRIPYLPSFVSRNPTLKEEIADGLVEAVHGMFLLAKLHLDSLVGKRSPRAVRTALSKLPTGSEAYDQAYESAMERIEGQVADQQALAKQALYWITCARRPLTTMEIRHALAVEIGEPEMDEDNIPDLEDIVSACAGLVTVDEQSDIIRLVHYTTQEYFRRTQARWFPDAETAITRTCVTYLSYTTFEIGMCKSDEEYGERLRQHPLYAYAALNWGHHARHSSTLGQEIVDFLHCEAKVMASGQALLCEKYGRRRFDEEHLPSETGLHLAALFGFEEGIRFLLQEGVEPDAKDCWGRTALYWAAQEGHGAVIKLLLDTGKTDPDSRDLDGQTPLSRAASRRREAVVKLLLETPGVEVNSRDNTGITPLSWAARYGKESTVKLLLETPGVDVDSRDDTGITPLSWAARYGKESTVKLLLETEKVDINSRDNAGRTPLSWVATGGKEAIVKLLLEAEKVDVNSRDNAGRTPLSWAATEGEDAVVKLLLEAEKVDINSRDDAGRTPLSWAATGGKEAIVKLLLETGKADLNSRDNIKRTPLSYAAEEGHGVIVTALISNESVDPDPRDHYGSTPLSIATRHQRTGVIKRLLNAGRIDVDSHDCFGRTPLWYSRRYGSDDITRLLEMYAAGLGLSACQDDIPAEVGARYPGIGRVCDVCTLWICCNEVYYHCRICNAGYFGVCLDCYEAGGRCLDMDHQLLKQDVYLYLTK